MQLKHPVPIKMNVLGSDGAVLRDLEEDDLLALSRSSSLCLRRWVLAASQEVRLRDNLLAFAVAGPAELRGGAERDENPGEVLLASRGWAGGRRGEDLRGGDSRPSEVGSAESEELDSGESSITRWFLTPWKHTQYIHI